MSERNSAFKQDREETSGIDTGRPAEAANEQWETQPLPGALLQNSESPKEVPSKIIDPFDEMLQTPEAREVIFESYKQLYEFALLNGFSLDALADIKAKAEAEELTPN